MKYFHATSTEENAKLIAKNGFTTGYGRFGTGVYFFSEFDETVGFGSQVLIADVETFNLKHIKYPELIKDYPNLSVDEEEGVTDLINLVTKEGYKGVVIDYNDGVREIVVYDTEIISNIVILSPEIKAGYIESMKRKKDEEAKRKRKIRSLYEQFDGITDVEETIAEYDAYVNMIQDMNSTGIIKTDNICEIQELINNNELFIFDNIYSAIDWYMTIITKNQLYDIFDYEVSNNDEGDSLVNIINNHAGFVEICNGDLYFGRFNDFINRNY